MTNPMSINASNASSKSAGSAHAKRPGSDPDAFSSMLAGEVDSKRPETARPEERPARHDDAARQQQPRDTRIAREPRDTRIAREAGDVREARDTREARDVREPREKTREAGDARGPRDTRDVRDTRRSESTDKTRKTDGARRTDGTEKTEETGSAEKTAAAEAETGATATPAAEGDKSVPVTAVPMDAATALLASVIPTSPAPTGAATAPVNPAAATPVVAGPAQTAGPIVTPATADLAQAAGPAATSAAAGAAPITTANPAVGTPTGAPLPEGFTPVLDGETVALPADAAPQAATAPSATAAPAATTAPVEQSVTTAGTTAEPAVTTVPADAAPAGTTAPATGQDTMAGNGEQSGDQPQNPAPGVPATPLETTPDVAAGGPQTVPTPGIDPARAAAAAGSATVADPALAAGAVAQPAAPAPAAPIAAATPVPSYAGTPGTAPAQQVAMHIAPLKLEADGIHRLTVHLHPVDLGPVSVVAEIRNGDINVQLSGGTEAGREALRNSMNDLRKELQDAGFGNTNLDLSSGTPQQNADAYQRQAALRNQNRGGYGRGGDGAPAADQPTTPVGASRGFFTDRGGSRRVDTTA